MTKVVEKIMDEVRSLDAEERSQLVNLLQDEFGPKNSGYEEAWAKEIQRREEIVAAGGGKFISAEEMLARMEQKIEEKRASALR